MIGAWSINVGGRAYGPYTADRMRAFAAEGRLAPSSLITREGVEDWREAQAEPEFAELFALQPVKPKEAERAEDTPQSSLRPATPTIGKHEDTGPSNFAIMVDLKSASFGGLEQAIQSLGPCYKVVPNIWILSAEATVNAVRNRLVQELGKSDSLFVIDATRGKAAWFNFGPQADARIRKVWTKTN